MRGDARILRHEKLPRAVEGTKELRDTGRQFEENGKRNHEVQNHSWRLNSGPPRTVTEESSPPATLV